MKKRIISMLLACMMIFSLMPMSVLAYSDNTVAVIGTTEYTTLAAAIDAAQDGDTITLLENATVAASVTFNKAQKYILDLNGKTLTVENKGSDDGIVVSNGADVTITSNAVGGKYVFGNTKSGNDAIYVNSNNTANATLTVNGKVEIVANSASNSVIHADGTDTGVGTINIAGNAVINASGSGKQFKVLEASGSATINVSGGKINANVEFDNYSQNNDVVGILAWGQPSEVNVTGGEFNISGKNAFAQAIQVGNLYGTSQAVINVSGGTFNITPTENGEGYVFTSYRPSDCDIDITDVIVKGNERVKGIALSGTGGTPNVEISGGTFNGVTVDPTYLKVAKVGENTYSTIKAAVDAADTSGEVELLLHKNDGENYKFTKADDNFCYVDADKKSGRLVWLDVAAAGSAGAETTFYVNGGTSARTIHNILLDSKSRYEGSYGDFLQNGDILILPQGTLYVTTSNTIDDVYGDITFVGAGKDNTVVCPLTSSGYRFFRLYNRYTKNIEEKVTYHYNFKNLTFDAKHATTNDALNLFVVTCYNIDISMDTVDVKNFKGSVFSVWANDTLNDAQYSGDHTGFTQGSSGYYPTKAMNSGVSIDLKNVTTDNNGRLIHFDCSPYQARDLDKNLDCYAYIHLNYDETCSFIDTETGNYVFTDPNHDYDTATYDFNASTAYGQGNCLINGVDVLPAVAQITKDNKTTKFGTLADAAKAAVEGDTIEIIKADTYAFSDLNALGGKAVTVKSTLSDRDDVILTRENNINGNGNRATYENLTIQFAAKESVSGISHSSNGGAATADVKFKNCVISGFLYGYDKMTFTECEFKLGEEESKLNMTTYGADVTYTRCTFDGSVNVYWDSINADRKIVFDTCTFNKADKVNDANAAVFIKADVFESKNYKLEVEFKGEQTLNGYNEVSVVDNDEVRWGGAKYISSDGLWQISLLSSTKGSTVKVGENTVFPLSNLTQGEFALKDADVAGASNVVAEDYKLVKAGENELINGYYLYTIASKTYVAQIDNQKYETLAEAVSAAKEATQPATITLLADISGSITVESGKNITLDLNGFALSPADNNTRVITNAGTFTLTDTSTGTVYKFAADDSGKWVKDNNGTFEVKSGYITGATCAIDNSGTFNMTGGALVGNVPGSAAATTASAIISSGEVNISGGMISGNVGSSGAITNKNGTLNISGGEISYNKVVSNDEKATILNMGSMEISGGKISNNVHTATAGQISGGAIYMKGSNSVLTMTGGEISNNSANDGGAIFFYGAAGNPATFNFEGGEIKNNIGGQGPCAYVGNNAVLNIEGGKISGHTKNASGGDANGTIFTEGANSTVNISGGEITENRRGVVNNGTMKMTGGKIYNNTEKAIYNQKNAEISGGEIYGNGTDLYNNSGTYSISGGYYDEQFNTSYLKAGYEIVDNENETNKSYVPYTVDTIKVAQVGTGEDAKKFVTLADAVTAANDETITLLDNITLTNTVDINNGKTFSIDLNDKNITGNGCRALWIKSGNVTLTGTGTISANGDNLSADSSVIRVGDNTNSTNTASLTVGENVTVSTEKCYGITAFSGASGGTGAKVTLVVDGTVISKDVPAISGCGNVFNGETDITVNGTVKAENENAIYFPCAGNLVINGTVEGNGGIEMKAGNATVSNVTIGNGATIKAIADTTTHNKSNDGCSTSGYALVAVENSGYKGKPSITVNGGKITGRVEIVADDEVGNDKKATISITGGYFSDRPKDYVATGYEVVEKPEGATDYPDGYGYKVGKITRTVTFDAGEGASCNTKSMTVTYGKPYGTLPVPTKTNSSFLGWFTAADDSGTEVTAQTVFNETKNVTLYAHWATNAYTVTFNANGGTCNVKSKNVSATQGATYGALPNPTRAGYTFDGWYDNADYTGTAVTYETNAPTKNITLYAKWTANKYTIAFDANGGSGSMASITGVESGNPVPLTTCGFEKSGYTFTGWNTAADGSGTTYANQAKVANLTESGTVTLYAQWKAETHTVTFDANGGNCVQLSKTIGATATTYGELPVPTHPYAEEENGFLGWFTAATDDTQVTEATNAPTVDGTLYAHWKFKTFGVTVNSAAAGSATYGTDYVYTIAEYSPSKTYNVTVKIGGESYYKYTVSGGTYTIPGTAITGAVEIASEEVIEEVVLTYMFDGKVFYTTKVAANGSYPNVTLPTKTGYNVDGWYVSDADNAAVATGTISATTLYAKATVKNIGYSFVNGETTVSSDNKNYGDSITFPTNPTNTAEKKFTGWQGDNGVFIPAQASVPNYSYKMPDVAALKFTSVWQQVGTLTITVQDTNGAVVIGAAVNLMKNGAVVQSAVTDAEGKAVFNGLDYGAYNVAVVSHISDTETVTTTAGQDITTGKTALTVTVPTYKLNTVVDSAAIDMNLTAENLDKATTDKPQTLSEGSQEITVRLKAEPSKEEDKQKINDEVSKDNAEAKMVDYVDLTVTKTTQSFDADGNSTGSASVVPITETSDYQIISIELTEGVYAKLAEIDGSVDNILVYRLHGAGESAMVAKLKKMPNETAGKNTNNECYWMKTVEGKDYVVVKVKNFSTYAIGYQDTEVEAEQPVTPVYYESSYTITGADTENGKLTVSKKNATAGSTVTITVTPDEGYKLDTLTVKDITGNVLTPTKVSDTIYTFRMPNSRVTISATFAKIPCPQDETCVYAKFTDANTKAWYHEGVHFCVENGYMQGVSATAFDPEGTTTRAMIVTMLWRMEGSPVANYAMSFEDVKADQWYTEAIRWAQSTGVVKGYSDEAFGPNDPITREQMATILYRYAKYHDVDVANTNTLAGFDDLADVSSWALDAMKWANAAGLVQGRTTTTLVPEVSITRAEAATMVQRYCEKVCED